jgi:hypothetical protein
VKRFALPTLVVCLVVVAGGSGYLIGRDDADGRDCETITTPVSDGSITKTVCVPPVLQALEPLPQVGPDEPLPEGNPDSATGTWLGELWVSDEGDRLCWLLSTDTGEVRCGPTSS